MEELEERYASPDDEDEQSRRRRIANRRQAISRFKSRKNENETKLNHLRDIDAQRKAADRATMTAQKLQCLRKSNAKSKATRRSVMSTEELNHLRETDAQRKATHRATMSPQELQRLRGNHAQSEATRRSTMTTEELNHLRETDAQRKATHRATMSPQELQHLRENHAQSEATRRSTMTTEELNHLRETDAQRKATHRATMSPQELQHLRENHAQSEATRRLTMTADELFHLLESNAQREAIRRGQMTPEELENYRAVHANREALRRQDIPEEIQEVQRQQTRTQYRNRVAQRQRATQKMGLGYHENFNVDIITGRDIRDGRHALPPMEEVCQHCQAIKWKVESKNCCCLDGKIVLAPYEDPPEEFKVLFTTPDFLQKIRSYNSVFSFTSMGASLTQRLNLDESLANGSNGVYTFRIQGAIYHRIGSLLPPEGRNPTFAQLYVFDTDMDGEVDARCSIMEGLDRRTIEQIQRILREVNPYVKIFKSAGEFAKNSNTVRLAIHEKVNIDLRTHNRPSSSEVAAIILDDTSMTENRDLVLHQRSGGLKRIFESWPAYDPLQYPLLFPYGEVGWSTAIQYKEGVTRYGNSRLSLREYISYCLHIKRNQFSLLHRAGRLFQQYCVDQYAKVEQQRLLFHQNNQKQLRAELYSGLQDMLAGDHTLAETGKHIVLAPSFTGGDRYMRQQYHDAMAIVRAYGKPDLFITVTCNPKWPEIVNNLLPGQRSDDRPDLVARVFHMKLKAILEDLNQKHVLGKIAAMIHVIEFQKRGLPHAHMLLILEQEDKPRTPDDFNLFVSAEIPDPARHEKLYNTVTKLMMHGPCGHLKRNAPCMRDNSCKKRFPKVFCDETKTDGNGYPLYRRSDNGRHTLRQRVPLDNRWVVPYNPFFCQKYDCHMNVEICSTVSSVKYLYKYVYKGHDKACISLQRSEGVGRNEIEEYRSARYISSSEAMWRLLDYSLQQKSHTIIHLESSNYVMYSPEDNVDNVLESGRHTMLTKFFDLCSQDESAASLVYHELPKHFVWNAGTKSWKTRKRGGEKAIGRMVSCSPADIERYHLRLLLCYRTGPKSFRDLRTIDGVEYSSYKDAALAAGYLEDDVEWHKCMEEASSFQMPVQLRQLFATILVYCQPSNMQHLWDSFIEALSEDFQQTLNSNASNPVVILRTLMDIDRHLLTNSKTLKDYPSLPQLKDFEEYEGEIDSGNHLLINERSYNTERLQEIVSALPALNDEQRVVYDNIMGAINNEESRQKLFFLDGPGGTGKSFLLEQILAKVRLENKIAIAVASSGIASLLLMGGRTAHSRFKLNLELTATSTCNISKQSKEAELIIKTSIIIWDEASMSHRYAFEAVNRLLQFLENNEQPFGGKVVLLAGDFRQTLPIVPRASDSQIIAACIKKSTLWHYFKTFQLKTNMRVRMTEDITTAASIEEFSNFLLQVGEGRQDVCPELGSNFVKLPRDLILQHSEENTQTATALIEHIYGDIKEQFLHQDYFCKRVILTPLNADVQSVNEEVMQSLPGPIKEYQSIDSVEDAETTQEALYPQEFLNTLSLNGMPPHKLGLKIGAPIILIRNINGEQGLCNGTRLRICRLTQNCIDAVVMTGSHHGTRTFLPRITLISNDDTLPFQLRRRQFPVQVAFAMTINKSQGQSIENLGVYLPQPVFAHGQLYVALSRVTARNKIKLLITNPALEEEDGIYTKNVVYRELIA